MASPGPDRGWHEPCAQRARPAARAAGGALLLAVVALALSGCGGEQPEVALYAAASLRDALGELEPLWEQRTGADLVLNLGGSGALRAQIEAGQAADLFLSAAVEEMDALERAGLLLAGTRRDLLSNRLVVVVPAGAARPAAPEALLAPEYARLALADPASVPAGRYARAWLEALGLWQGLESRVLPCLDVRAALAAVETGAAQAGIVYASDARSSERVEAACAAEGPAAPAIRYPLAVLAGRPREALVRDLAAFLASPEATEVFALRGFLPAHSSAP